MGRKPLARYAALNNFVTLGQSFGLDPARLVRAAGLDPAGLNLPDRWVPAVAVADLLERAAGESGHEDFGLRLAELRRISSLGPLSLAIREEPDVRSALKILARHENMYNEALHTHLTERNGVGTIALTIDLGEPGETRQAVELGVGVLHSLLRDFLGSGWCPLEVDFTHSAPGNLDTHHRIFGGNIGFDREFNGIVVYTTDLDATNALSDPLLRSYTQQFLGTAEPVQEPTTAGRVRDLIETLLPTGRCSAEQVARSLGIERRTVHRHLAQEGETFSSILDDVRADLADRLVTNRRYAFTEIAEMLAFSSHSNFTRWFRNHYGCSPSRWRRTHATSTAPPS
ncbi:AraC family transcriptional regulator [Nocardia sp. NBC_01329]|uniref:AraC family transcriptional regulator n=1 Tax=Nocardia sp. NBC_01329 TaxID=2903594 RepID=UPI002E101A41|nr:AraC family transcriptional regulator [Nocardia sp. NBC_01329]